MSITTIPVRHKFCRTKEDLPEELQTGTIYYIADEHTIQVKDISVSGINRVSFNKTGNTTEILFNDDYGTDGNVGRVIVSNDTLVDLVNSLKDELLKVEQNVVDLNLSTHTIYNMDDIASTSTPYTLETALDTLEELQVKKVRNAGIIFYDGTKTSFYIFNGDSSENFYNTSYWQEVQTGSDNSVQHYIDRVSFPAIGQSNVLYIDDTNDELFSWDNNILQYKQCGFNPSNIDFIDSNF